MKSAQEIFRVEKFVSDCVSYIKRHQMTAIEVANKTGIREGNVRRFLRGSDQPSLYTACAFAEMCNISLDDYRRGSINGRSTRVA